MLPNLPAGPDELSDADGAVLEPLGVAIHSYDLGHLPLGDTAAVIGCGPIGLLLVQLLGTAGGRGCRPGAAVRGLPSGGCRPGGRRVAGAGRLAWPSCVL
jgi:hypothetical protein